MLDNAEVNYEEPTEMPFFNTFEFESDMQQRVERESTMFILIFNL